MNEPTRYSPDSKGELVEGNHGTLVAAWEYEVLRNKYEILLAEGALKDAVVAAAIEIRNGQAEPKFAVDRQLWAALDALSSASGNQKATYEDGFDDGLLAGKELAPADSRQPVSEQWTNCGHHPEIKYCVADGCPECALGHPATADQRQEPDICIGCSKPEGSCTCTRYQLAE